MGIIFSKPVNYIKGKITDTGQFIQRKVNNAADFVYTGVNNSINAVVTRINNTKSAITDRINQTKNKISTTAHNVTNAVTTCAYNTKTGITNGYCNIRDGTVTRVQNTRNATIEHAQNIKNKYNNTKQAVSQTINQHKESVKSTVNSVSNYGRSSYQKIRAIKLTRKQKIFYGFLSILISAILIINALLLYDVYSGDFQAAKVKVDVISKCVSVTVQYSVWLSLELLSLIQLGLFYLWIGICIVAAYLWQGIQLAAEYSWLSIKYISYYTLEGTNHVCVFIYNGAIIILQYIGLACSTFWEYFCMFMSALGHHIFQGLCIAAHYLYEAGQVIGEASMKASKVCYERGSVILRGGLVELFRATKDLTYFLAVASYEGSIWTFYASITACQYLWKGSIEGSIMLYHGTVFVGSKTYYGTKTAVEYTQYAYHNTAQVINDTTTFAAHWSSVGATNVAYAVKTGSAWSYNTTIVVSNQLMEWTVVASIFAFECSIAGAEALKGLTELGAVSTGHWLYKTLNQGLLRGLFRLVNACSGGLFSIGLIMFSFLTETCSKFSQFFYIIFTSVYYVLYILFAFVYQILGAIAGAIKLVLGGMVVCVTSVFSVIIWGLEESLFAYAFMLHKYNMYREILFFGFIGLITLYCTGLMRDRQRAYEEGEESEEEEDEEFSKEFIDGLLQDTPSKTSSGSDSPPPYRARPSRLPCAETQEDSDLDSDLPDQEVPDFMHLSDSEPEPEPPDASPYNSEGPVLSSGGETDAEEEARQLAERVASLKASKVTTEAELFDDFTSEQSGTESTDECRGQR